MSNKQHNKTVVWIASGRTTPAEQEFIDNLGNCSLMNAQFFSKSPSENIGATRVYNLSGRADIDEFYDAILVKQPVVIPASIVIESDLVDEVQEEGQEEALQTIRKPISKPKSKVGG